MQKVLSRKIKSYIKKHFSFKRTKKRSAFFSRVLTIASFALFFSLTLSLHLFAAPPGSKFSAGETLDPSCAPGDTNCSVETASSDSLGFTQTTWSTSFDGAQEQIHSLATYEGNLYAGQGTGAGDGDVYVYDGSSWTLAHDFGATIEAVFALAVYDGNLYAGLGNSSGDGDVYVYDGSSWTLAHDLGATIEAVRSMAVHDDKLYVGTGTGTGDGDIWEYDGATWTEVYAGSQEQILALTSFNGNLYAGNGVGAGDGDILMYDGSTWTTVYDGSEEYFFSLLEYNGKLYAGQAASPGDGDVFVCTPATSGSATDCDPGDWTVSYDGAGYVAQSLVVHDDKLYMGQYGGTDSNIYVFNGTTWSLSYDGDGVVIAALVSHDGDLYAGQGNGAGNGDVLIMETSTLTADTLTNGAILFGTGGGSIGQNDEDLYWDNARNRLGIGTNTPQETLHINGFLRTEDIGWQTFYSTGSNDIQTMLEYNGYFYVGLGDLSGWGDIIAYDGTNWTTSYDGAGSQTYNLITYNGLLYVGQGNGAGLGDILVCDPTTTGDVDYCDSGDWSTSYDGAQEGFRSMAVYNGKLYATQGTGSNDADVYMCDPTLTGNAYACDSGDWSLFHDFGATYEFSENNAMKAYNGKLYVGLGNGAGNGDIWVYDGSTWSMSRDGAESSSMAMEVYNGKLYAGTFGGNIYVFDGETWTLTYDSPSGYIQAMAVYNGKLYASGSNQYIYVYDGSSWKVSSGVGASGESESLGVYNGKLYGVNQNGALGQTGARILVYSERLESQLAKTTRPVTSFNEQYQHFIKNVSINTPDTTTGSSLSITANALTTGSLLSLVSSTTTAASNSHKGLTITLSGANANDTQTTYGAYITNTHTGTTSTNVGLYASATGATNNYAGIFEAGFVGINQTTPGVILHTGNSATTDGDIFRLQDADGTCNYNPESGGVTVACSSDERLKENIRNAVSTLDYIKDIKIHTYEVIASGDTVTGTVAQELILTHPELVSMGEDGYYQVRELTSWQVVHGLQELNLKITGLQTLIDETFLTKIRTWLASATNGIVKVFVGEVETRKLCLEDLCITRTELEQLLDGQSVTPVGNTTNEEEPTDTETPEEETVVEEIPTEEEPPLEETPAETEEESAVEETPTPEEPGEEETGTEEPPVEEEPEDDSEEESEGTPPEPTLAS